MEPGAGSTSAVVLRQPKTGPLVQTTLQEMPYFQKAIATVLEPGTWYSDQ